MPTIAAFLTPDDRAFTPRLQEMLPECAIKVAMLPEEYFPSIARKVVMANADYIITTCNTTLLTLLKAIPDFRQPRDKRGTLRKLSMDDYAGSFFRIPASKISEASKLQTEKDIYVLALNPLAHLVKTAEGPFVFRRFVSKITKPQAWMPQAAFTWEVWNPSRSAQLFAKFCSAEILSIDIETYVGDIHRRINCVGYCALFRDGSTHAIVVPFDDILAWDFVRKLNATAHPRKLFQNGLYDNLYFLRWNAPVCNWLYDTQHLFHSWYAELPKRLDFITAFTVREIRFWKDDAHGGDRHAMFEYNAKDCWATLMSWLGLMREVPQWAITNYLAEFPLVFPCLHVEADGLSLNAKVFDTQKAAVAAACEATLKRLQTWMPNFNPGSSDQCKRLLAVLGVKTVESADAKALDAAASVSPFNTLIIGEIIKYRKQAKLLSTYFVWDKFWNNRLYYKINPAGTDTGRMASAESSFWCGLQIQNIPATGTVKSWIVADAEWHLAEGDFAQSEARCVAYLSGCASLLDLVESDKDYHTQNASAFFGVPYDAVDKPLRQLAKRVGHGANYNMGASVLLATMGPKAVEAARNLLKLPGKWNLVQVAQHLLRTYEHAYPEVKRDWYTALTRTILLTKKLISPLNHTRHFFDNPKTSKAALNAAVAHSPQNLSGGILNIAFMRIWRASLYGDLKGKVRLKAQIHDSIFYGWRGEGTPEIVRKMMEVPIPVTDIKGVTRTLLIPPDMSAHDKDGNPANSWAALK